MGSAIGRIEREFILQTLFSKKIPLSIHGKKKEIKGDIIRLDDSSIEVQLDKDVKGLFSPRESVRVFFPYYGHIMTFNSEVLRANESITLSYPKEVYKNLQRKYERVTTPEGITASFTLSNIKVALSYPKIEEYDPVDVPEVSDDFDCSDIRRLVDDFRQKVRAMNATESIVMFRGREAQSLDELLISRTGRILFVPDTEKGIPEAGEYAYEHVITASTIMSLQEQTHDTLYDLERFQFEYQQKNHDGIHGEMYCPILYHAYVVGYVRVSREGEDDTPFSISELAYVHDFSRVLAYSLKIYGYFKDEEKGAGEFSPEIIDISASGLLFSHPSQELKLSLLLYNDVLLTLRVGHRKMNIGCRVMRKYPEKNTTCYGLQFMDIQPEDFRFLFDYVYGKDLTEEDERLWEGGAPPPELKL
jgi:hypothetical protein